VKTLSNADVGAPNQEASFVNITSSSFDAVVSADEAFDMEVTFASDAAITGVL
jgi:hypothetical protein